MTGDVIVPDAQVDPVIEQAEAAPDAPEGDVTAVVDGVDSPAGDALTGTVETESDPIESWLADESNRTRLFEHPSVAEKLRERENAGAQRREAQLKREAGAAQVTEQNVAALFAAAGLDPSEPVQDAQGRDLMPRARYLYALAQANAAVELTKVIPDVMLKDFSVPAEVREQALDMRADGKPADEWLKVLVTGAAEAKVSEMRKADESKITAEVNRRLAAEIKARGLEAAPKRAGAPPIPVGAASGGDKIPYSQMTREQRAALTPSERDAAVAVG